jgi:hypothetical protein
MPDALIYMGTCGFKLTKVLAGAVLGPHNTGGPLMSGGSCSQGGVKLPTGGKGEVAQARERLP